MTDPIEIDEIDRIVDRLVKDDETAADLKKALHKKDATPEPEADVKGNGDDLWDNLPV